MNKYPAVILVMLSLAVAADTVDANQPNVLWITAEDMSPTLGCYGDEFATTPQIDRLADQSVKYSHAFATAPVCSPSRSCLITGCYAPSLGTHQMRSAFSIPDFMAGWPSILRKSGYYTSNNVKTDYNTGDWQRVVRESWDESSAAAHWRNRKDKSQPFFSVFNLMTSHQSRSMVWPYERFQSEVQSKLEVSERHAADSVPLPPYYVDTPLVRREMARYYDCVTAMDKQVGELLSQLQEDGLAENTIVFFYSDHGSGMPRHKRALLDSGMHVPLLIRFPESLQQLAPAEPGEWLDRLVSFVDFPASVLNVLGLSIPEYMQGQPFLGDQQAEPREYVYGHRDRVDEVIDLSRSVRDKRFLYIRNYMPHLGYNQPTAWPDSGEIRHDFYSSTDSQKMSIAQWQFAGPSRPVEELYDCQSDPQNLKNLAFDVEHRDRLKAMRTAHVRHVQSTRDLGFIPEVTLWNSSVGTTAWEYARAGDAPVCRSFTAASLSGIGDEEVFLKLLTSDNETRRYWAVIGLAAMKSVSQTAETALIKHCEDASWPVRIVSASQLVRRNANADALKTLELALNDEDLNVVLMSSRYVQLLGGDAVQLIPAMQRVVQRTLEIRPPGLPATVVQSGDQDLAMFIGFAANAFLASCNVEGGSDGEWQQLFDGKSLNGWRALVEGNVDVADGEIQILSKGKNLWLISEKSFGDFELSVDAMMPSGVYNSGVGFRCTAAKSKPKGYQCEIDKAKSGMIYAIGSGWVWPKGDEQTKRFQRMAGDSFRNEGWNRLRIRCEGDRIQTWVNGVLTADVRDSKFSNGSVALQHHGKGGLHRFRNIKIREL